MKSHLLKFTARTGLLCCLLVSALSCDQGEVIEKIGNESITTAQYEDNYNTSVELATRYANAEKSTLYKLVCNPSLAPNAQARDMALQLAPSVNYQQFRDARIVEIVAEEEGFLDRPVVQKILEQTRRNTLAQLYVTEKLWERIKISEEDKQKTCQELRKEDPARVGPLPLDDCLRIAEGILKTQQSRREAQKVFDEIKEKVKITKNEEFDREDYLKNGLELYTTIKTEGGCADVESDAADPEGKAPAAKVPGF